MVAGARRHKVCAVLEIAVRTLQRWQKTLQEENTLADHRQAAAVGRTSANKLSEAERQAILGICHSPEFRSLPPSQIVPRLADEGMYVASESSFYRVLREADQVNRRGRAKAPRSVPKPEGFQATGPNQVWSWDITFLASNAGNCPVHHPYVLANHDARHHPLSVTGSLQLSSSTGSDSVRPMASLCALLPSPQAGKRVPLERNQPDKKDWHPGNELPCHPIPKSHHANPHSAIAFHDCAAASRGFLHQGLSDACPLSAHAD